MKSPTKTWPRSACGIENGSGGAPKIMRSACSATIARPKVSSSDERRIGAVEAAEQQPLDDQADQRDQHRRQRASAPAKPSEVGELTAR